MPKTKTPAKLTVPQATRQARKHVDLLMPGTMTTVETRGTADPQTLAPLMRTVVTFDPKHPNASALYAALSGLPGVRSVTAGAGHYTITRTV